MAHNEFCYRVIVDLSQPPFTVNGIKPIYNGRLRSHIVKIVYDGWVYPQLVLLFSNLLIELIDDFHDNLVPEGVRDRSSIRVERSVDNVVSVTMLGPDPQRFVTVVAFRGKNKPELVTND